MTANSDYTLSKKLAEKNTQYYEASNTAEAFLAQTDTVLSDLYRSSAGSSSSYCRALPDIMDSMELPDGIINYSTDFSTEDNGSVSFEVPMSDTRFLAVTLLFSYPEFSGDNFYKITSWQTVTRQLSDTESDTLPLFTGDTP